jgi:ABC-2 type transport system permease protein
MNTVYRVFIKEVSGYISSASSYIFLIVFTILAPSLFFFMGAFFREQAASMGAFFAFIPWIFMFFIPAISMRLWAEEKKQGTEELLMTLPVRDWEVVIGKYLAALLLVTFALLLTFPVYLCVQYFAESSVNPNAPAPDKGPIICGYLGSFLLGASFLALGSWCSSLTREQIIAFILSCTGLFVLTLIGFQFITGPLPSFLGEILSMLSPGTHFGNMYRGVIELSNITYFLSFIILFLYLNVRSIESRKWN